MRTLRDLIDDDEERHLRDGIYEVPLDIEVLVFYDTPFELDINDEIKNFLINNPKWVIASAYETSATIILSRKPYIYSGKTLGGGFNYGSTNLLEDCPPRLLILAEND